MATWDQLLENNRLITLIDPGQSLPYYGYGQALAKSGKKKAAIMMYQKALNLNPNEKVALEALKK